VLAPVLGQALLVALKASESIQRRLNSIVQNSTDVVTIVGADHRVRWQAESIRRVLGHSPTRSSARACAISSTRTTAPRSTATSPTPKAIPSTAAR